MNAAESARMIKMESEAGEFKLRVVGVVLHNGKILLNRKANEPDHWVLPGGTCEIGEASVDTLKREMWEEGRQTVSIGRMVWIVENILKKDHRLESETGLFFQMSLSPDSEWLASDGPYQGKEGKDTLIFQWFPVDQLQAVPLYPSFLRAALGNIPDQIEHRIEKGE